MPIEMMPASVELEWCSPKLRAFYHRYNPAFDRLELGRHDYEEVADIPSMSVLGDGFRSVRLRAPRGKGRCRRQKRIAADPRRDSRHDEDRHR